MTLPSTVAVLGTGMVGQALASGIHRAGADVVVGTRDPDASLARRDPPAMGEAFGAWHDRHPDVPVLSLRDAAGAGDLVVNATLGAGSLDALRAAGAEALGDKVLLDVSNPLDFSGGFPPSLFVTGPDSLAEQVQRAFPRLRVVKALNTMTASVMVDPGSLADGAHTAFVSGDDAEAKAAVTRGLVGWFGWRPDRVLDLGGLSTARGTEGYLPLWLHLMSALGTGRFNVAVVR